ncbi:MAG: LCP family protein [Solobacterium sp.]|nr:LCP family protein [Solobacterium sp.]
MSEQQQTKRAIGAGFYWVLALLVSIVFSIVIFFLGILPLSWCFYILAGLAFLLAILGALSSKFYRSKLVKFLNLLLAFILGYVSIMGPYYSAKLLKLFDSFGQNDVIINVYVMKDQSDNLMDYQYASFITGMAYEESACTYALDEISNTIGNQYTTLDYDSIYSGADSLYRREGDAFIMKASLETLLTSTEAFANFLEDTKVIATYILKGNDSVIEGSKDLVNEPFAIFFGGNDQEGELSTLGRTDVNILVVVNPTTGQLIQVNIPRDSYIPNPAYGYASDKLTHLGVNGIENTLEGIGDYFGVEVKNYVLLNFTTYRQVIDSLGGVSVNNPYAFGFWDNPSVWFEEGPITLSGEDALLYVRERKTLPDGDFGRVMHQQLVMNAIMQKLTSRSIIFHFGDLLRGLDGKFLTNIYGRGVYKLVQKQLVEGTDWDMISYRIDGGTGGAYCAIAPYQELSVVFPDEAQVELVKNEIQMLLRGERITQK